MSRKSRSCRFLQTRHPLWRKRTRSWRFPLKPQNLSTWPSRPTCSTTCWPFPTSGWNFTWARTGQSVATGCTAGGKRTAATVTGASMAVTSPCATGSGRKPVKSRSRDITWVFTGRRSLTTSSGEAKVTWAVNPAERFGTRRITRQAWNTVTRCPSQTA